MNLLLMPPLFDSLFNFLIPWPCLFGYLLMLFFLNLIFYIILKLHYQLLISFYYVFFFQILNFKFFKFEKSFQRFFLYLMKKLLLCQGLGVLNTAQILMIQQVLHSLMLWLKQVHCSEHQLVYSYSQIRNKFVGSKISNFQIFENMVFIQKLFLINFTAFPQLLF